MPIYGIRHHKLIQTSYFQSDMPLERNSHVIVELDQGLVLGRVVSGPHTDLEGIAEDTLPRVERVAGDADLEQARLNDEVAMKSKSFWKECVQRRNLDMKLVDVELFFDCSKLIFYFTAVSRVDFRELVKDLVHEYRMRIELRQIGVRHETQMVGALGNCGMVCCCKRYLHQFAPVTIRMAKDQNLFLNPSKVSGLCGRLLCCLAYEQGSYDAFQQESPRIGKRYETDSGQFKIVRVNMFRNSVTCTASTGEEHIFSLEEWKSMHPHRLDGSQHHSETDEHKPECTECKGGEDGSSKKRKDLKFVTGRNDFHHAAELQAQSFKLQEEHLWPEKTRSSQDESYAYTAPKPKKQEYESDKVSQQDKALRFDKVEVSVSLEDKGQGRQGGRPTDKHTRAEHCEERLDKKPEARKLGKKHHPSKQAASSPEGNAKRKDKRKKDAKKQTSKGQETD